MRIAECNVSKNLGLNNVIELLVKLGSPRAPGFLLCKADSSPQLCSRPWLETHYDARPEVSREASESVPS